MHSHSQSVQYSKCGVRVVVIVCWPLCLSAMHHYHHIALNYNELTRTPLTLFHQCFPVERRHLRHYNNCSLTIAVPLVMRIQDGSGRDRLKFSPNIRQEHEIKACTLVFLYYLNDTSTNYWNFEYKLSSPMLNSRFYSSYSSFLHHTYPC